MHVDNSSDEESSFTSLNDDVKLPPDFILPDFTPYQSNEDIYNIFNMDARTIEEIWLDCARDMIRGLLLLPDEYVILVRVSKYNSSCKLIN